MAASLVWRAFDPSQLPVMPSRQKRAALAAAFPDAPLSLYPKSGHALARDFKWLDSTRYGVVNLGARDWVALRDAFAQVAALLG